MSNRKHKSKAKSQTSIKGKLVEMIVASMHEYPNVKVERNVRLPALHNSKRKREIDVLVSGWFSGYPIKIAIECKNHKSIIDVPYIDAFVGMLQDIGIPSQHGIYVSTVGFTDGAIERANESGIKPFVLTGLNSDRLSANIIEAIQTVIYLLPEITKLSVTCEVPRTENPFQMWFLYDDSGKMRAALPDLVWRKWVDGGFPSEIGEYDTEIEIPKDWKVFIDGEYKHITSAMANIRVTGLVITVQGKATQHALVNPTDHKINRYTTNVAFDIPSNIFPLISFSSEGDLRKYFINRPEPIKLTIGRIKLPRVRFSSLYWPLSARAVTEFAKLGMKCLGEGRKASADELAKIEGSDLKTVWEPVGEEQPFLQEMEE